MTEYEEIRNSIDHYLMERFKYRVSLVYLTMDNVIAIRRNSRVDLYLRIRKVESIFPSNCLIIARLGFKKERIGNGTHFIRFLTELAIKHDFKHIGIECTNEKSSAFAKKLGFYSLDDSNFAITIDSLINYLFINRIDVMFYLSEHKDIFQE